MRSNVLESRDFRFLFFARVLTATALQVQAVIVGWQVYQLTADPLLLGLLGLTEAIPAIGTSFFSGHIVDTNRPSLILRLSTAALFLNTIFLFAVARPEIAIGNRARLVCLFLGIFISGAGRSFASPANFSLIPQIVPRSLLSAAAAWHSSAYQFASILGPAFGGIAYGLYGASVSFAIPPILMAFGFASVSALSPATRALRSPLKAEPFLRSLKSGIRFTLDNKVLLSTMLLDMFSVLFGGAVAVLPMFSDQILHAGSEGLGFLRAAPAVGSGLVAFWLGFKPLREISGRRLLIVVGGFGLASMGFAFSTNFYLAFLFLGLSGAFDGVSMVIRSTIMQLLTPDHMRGRVSALSSIFISSSNEIGAFESGLAAKVMGLVPSLIFGSAMTLGVVGATGAFFPKLRRARISTDGTDIA